MFSKRTPYRNPKILAAAKGEECTVQSPYCNGNPETTVAAHSNYSEDGKGLSTKADDCYVCFACSSCHDFIDGRIKSDTVERDFYFHRAMKRTWRRLIDKGIIK